MHIAQLENVKRVLGNTSGLVPASAEGIACAMAPSVLMDYAGSRQSANSAQGHFHAPLSAIDLFTVGNLHMELQQPAEAIASYDQAITLDPCIPEIHFNRANALAACKHYGEALSGYDAAIALRAYYAQAHSNRGNTLYALGQYFEAIASFDQAISLNPEMAEAYLNRGNALTRLGRYTQAFQSYEMAIGCNPDLVEAIFNKGIALQIMLLEQGGE
ncbi:tetratricopeptide repeat protein [Rhodoferax lacus]|jgi:tetratricopeptide (TPR) repeat protein|nr:tetratricopeptide repeat protein [Rhodoferax lacus]